MKYRKLRIAWSVGCAIACGLLVGLWMRSYWLIDEISVRRGQRMISVRSDRGEIMTSNMLMRELLPFGIELESDLRDDRRERWLPTTHLGFGYQQSTLE